MREEVSGCFGEKKNLLSVSEGYYYSKLFHWKTSLRRNPFLSSFCFVFVFCFVSAVVINTVSAFPLDRC